MSKWVKKVALCNVPVVMVLTLRDKVAWQDTMVNGMRSEPPHDKSGHTWHDPDEMLLNLTKYGYKGMINDD